MLMKKDIWGSGARLACRGLLQPRENLTVKCQGYTIEGKSNEGAGYLI